LFKVSHIPSHPIIIKSGGFLTISYSLTSGSAIINYLFSGIFEFYLYSKSPIALDKFKFPLTLPSHTSPPASLILANSLGFSGLWSSDKALASP